MLDVGPPNQRNTMVLNPPPPPSLKNCLQEPASTGQPHLSFPPVCLVYWERRGEGVSGEQPNEHDCCHFGKAATEGQASGFRPPGHRAALETAAPAWAELCAQTSGEEAANLQIPAQTRQLPSARKVLLIKPVHLITGRSIKYFSRCFRCSLWALVKAGEACDQGCWPCGAGARSPLAWTRPAPSATQSALPHLLCRLAKAQSVIT